ncbi:MAG: hypothetical protein Q9227_000710 [Pyrenula ochraceoflavens]
MRSKQPAENSAKKSASIQLDAVMLLESFVLIVSSVVRAADCLNHINTFVIPDQGNARTVSPNLYGYSIEPLWLGDYISSNLTSILLSYITEVVGQPPEIRIGGSSSDYTYYHAEQQQPYELLPNRTSPKAINISSGYYSPLSGYFPKDTKFTYTLNFADRTGPWPNALAEAQSITSILGSQLVLFELGNEVDHYVGNGYRPSGRWNVSDYVPQFRSLSDEIMSSSWYAESSRPLFQAAVFADPPLVPDQSVDQDDMSIPNLTAAGLVNDRGIIPTYCVHLYPQSTCDAPRRARLSLNLLSDHRVLYQNVSQYIPAVAAAEAAGSTLIMGETNSASCSGRSGISDVFTAALWATDYVFMSASLGIEKVFFHLGSSSEYSAWVPLPYSYQGQNLTMGVRANFYSHWFTARVIGDNGPSLTVKELESANASDFSAYAFYDQTGGGLEKLVFLDMGVWNSSEGLSNPSTISSTDSTSVSPGIRPVRNVTIESSWDEGERLRLVRMAAPGSNAKSGITVDGVSFDITTGAKIGTSKNESAVVGSGGLLSVSLQKAEALLIEKA